MKRNIWLSRLFECKTWFAIGTRVIAQVTICNNSTLFLFIYCCCGWRKLGRLPCLQGVYIYITINPYVTNNLSSPPPEKIVGGHVFLFVCFLNLVNMSRTLDKELIFSVKITLECIKNYNKNSVNFNN